MGVLTGLQPTAVFRYFEEICGIPHGSRDTKVISDYCVQFAKEHGLRYLQDDTNNVIIWKDGTPGYENSAPVMIQGHLDMVCEKETGCAIDFQTDGLELELKDGKISAKGTTLGGDDGIAVSYALALLDSSDIPHPPLEIVLTVDEEIGMLGATALDASSLQSRIMLNVDSEDEGYLLASCAGGVTAVAHLPITFEQQHGDVVTITVTGLKGGHSGVEIDKGRANACQLLGRTLYVLSQLVDFRVVAISGGMKDNAIPREAAARLVLGAGVTFSQVAQILEVSEAAYMNEFRSTDAGVRICKELVGSETVEAFTTESTDKVITALVNLPGGIQRMSFDIEGLVQTSLNLGILQTGEEEVTFSFAVRSSVGTEKQALVNQIQCLMHALGGSLTMYGDYPAWEYRPDSALRDTMVRVFEEQYGRKPVVQAIHAGLECGLFCGKLPGLDCISFGPDMQDIHTPKETLDVDSVRRTWDYLLAVLKELK
ncbi:MAG: aminoacyl-histidine dipeptidase [Lachnospiraceae bacterium]